MCVEESTARWIFALIFGTAMQQVMLCSAATCRNVHHRNHPLLPSWVTPPWECKIACFVVVSEVPKASHPDIASNKDPDCIVHFLGLKVVVQQEQHLHKGTSKGCDLVVSIQLQRGDRRRHWEEEDERVRSSTSKKVHAANHTHALLHGPSSITDNRGTPSPVIKVTIEGREDSKRYQVHALQA